MNFQDYIGWSLYVFGIVFEVVADVQKTLFRQKSENRGKFITSGLWSISRHPNVSVFAGVLVHSRNFSPWYIYSNGRKGGSEVS